MFVGHAEDHTGDVYRFIHLKTQHVILSKDARWMNIMWKAYMRKLKHINHGLQIIDTDTISPVVSLFLLRSNNSMTQTSQ